jgi:YD repeat-containing protein
MVRSVKDENGSGYTFSYDYKKGEESSYAMIKSSDGLVKEVWYDKDQDTRRVAINGETILSIEKMDPPDDTGRSPGRILLETDESGNTTRKEYNEWGQFTRVVHPDGTEELTVYDHTLVSDDHSSRYAPNRAN